MAAPKVDVATGITFAFPSGNSFAAEVTDMDHVVNFEPIEATHFGSTKPVAGTSVGGREWIQPDLGNVTMTLEVHMDPNDMMEVMYAGTISTITITLPAGDTLAGAALVGNWNTSAIVNDKMTATVDVQFTGVHTASLAA